MKKPIIITAALIAVVTLTFAFWTPLYKAVAETAIPYLAGDPDMPESLMTGMKRVKGSMTKEEFMIKRAEAVALRRGIHKDVPFDPSLRPLAIEKMERQESFRNKKFGSDNAIVAAWTPIGPNPIPNGQTTPTAPVSGRIATIAVHPTNPAIVYVGAAQGGVFRSTDSGANWTPVFDSAQNLAIGAISFSPSDPTILYVGTGEPNFGARNYFGVGVYRINTNAVHTTATLTGPLNKNAGGADVFTGRGIGEIAVHPTQPGTIFVGSTSGTAGLNGAVNVPVPPRGIYRSTNADTAAPTFAQLPFPFTNQNLSVRDISLDPQNPDNLVMNVIANGGGLLTTNNALNADPTTVTFTLTQQFLSSSTSELTAEFTVQKSGGVNGARTYYAATGNLGGRVLRSTDSGATWVQQVDNDFCTPQCFYDIAIDIDPTNVDTLYLGGSPRLIFGKSVTAGTAFVPVTAGLHVDTHAITVAPSDPLVVYLGTDGGIYRSDNAGVSFINLNNTTMFATQFIGMDVHPTDPNFTLAGTQDNGTNLYQPSATWFRADFGDGGYAVIDQNAVDPVNVTMYHTYFNQTTAMGYARVMNTANATDGNWDFFGCGFGGAIPNGFTCAATAINFYPPMERGPGTPNTLYFGSDVLYRSDDAGDNMVKISQEPIVAGVAILSIGISPQNDNVRIVGLNNGALFGTSTGANPLVNLDPTNTVPNAPINRSVIDPNTATTAYVTLSVFGFPNVYKTMNLADAGTTWFDSSGTGGTNPLPQVPINVIIVDPLNSQILYVGTDIGVFSSVDGGANWQPFGTGLPRLAIFDMKITSDRMVRIATHGRGMYQIPVLLAPTAASASVSGRVTTNRGRGLSNATIRIADSQGESRTATTNVFGYFVLSNLQAGESYTVTTSRRGYRFTPQIITLNEDLVDFNISPADSDSGEQTTKGAKEAK